MISDNKSPNSLRFVSTAKRRRRKDDRVVSTGRQQPLRALRVGQSGRIGPRVEQPIRGDSQQKTILAEGNESLVYRFVKRAFDVAGAIVLMILFAPIMLTTLLVLAITTRGRPIFVQQRVGLCGRLFPMIKFRTMVVNAAKLQHLVTNEKDGPVFKNRRDPRITRIGAFLRSTSIDEMPQLINVLLGQMSLVGPRPPVPSEVAKYQPWQLRRLAVKPGLTCLWQVSGRCEIGFDEWVRMDLWYLRHQNLPTDISLLAKTPLSVLSRRGAY
ncbi:MAG TPA: sugar transferase [Pirellulales bacterium]|nr:sugar transferase [Pirellulales bacterium]